MIRLDVGVLLSFADQVNSPRLLPLNQIQNLYLTVDLVQFLLKHDYSMFSLLAYAHRYRMVNYRRTGFQRGLQTVKPGGFVLVFWKHEVCASLFVWDPLFLSDKSEKTPVCGNSNIVEVPIIFT